MTPSRITERLRIALVMGLLALTAGRLEAQTATAATATIIGAGYSAPTSAITAAPGQVLSIVVSGFEYRLQAPVVAAGLPLPPSLAGFTVTVQQGAPQNTFTAPLFSVSQTLLPCASAQASCPALTILNVQIPFELVPDCLLCLRPAFLGFLFVSDRGTATTSIALTVPGDNVHLISPCDSTAGNLAGACGKLITHGDGRAVTTTNPARVGEELVMYAFGLGQTQPLVPTGKATPSPAPQFPSGAFGLRFDFTPNAAPSLPTPRPPIASAPQPVYAGLVPAFVGLYQVNFIVPPPPAGNSLLACGAVIGIPNPVLVVQTNLTVNLFGPFSFDGAAICVQP